MSLPNEILRSLCETGRFLVELCDGTYKDVPESVCYVARSLVRHYPSSLILLRDALAEWEREYGERRS